MCSFCPLFRLFFFLLVNLLAWAACLLGLVEKKQHMEESYHRWPATQELPVALLQLSPVQAWPLSHPSARAPSIRTASSPPATRTHPHPILKPPLASCGLASCSIHGREITSARAAPRNLGQAAPPPAGRYSAASPRAVGELLRQQASSERSIRHLVHLWRSAREGESSGAQVCLEARDWAYLSIPR